MGRGFIKYLYLLLLLGCSTGVLLAQSNERDLEKIEADLISGKNHLLLEELQKKTELKKNQLNPLILAQYQSLLGDYYLNKSDIELAKKYWDLSSKTIEAKFGQNSSFKAFKYNNQSKYYGFLIKSDSALYFAEKAVSICRLKRDSLKFIRADKIYKQYGYALKVRHIKQKTEAYSCLKKANSYYDKAIKEMPNEFEKTNQLLSNIYFVKGLTYLYCYVNDSLNPLLKNLHNGLVALTPSYTNQSVISCPSSNNTFLNESSVLILLHFKIDALHNLYLQTKDLKYLEACYEHSKTAFVIWKNFFSELKTEEIHLATEMYGAAPFS
ncbi:MAG: hypothetical protein HY062_01035, partial [Bacteroidetes bacterium]|nr:hypothetical protein [Bacteroidota bacterium]